MDREKPEESCDVLCTLHDVQGAVVQPRVHTEEYLTAYTKVFGNSFRSSKVYFILAPTLKIITFKKHFTSFLCARLCDKHFNWFIPSSRLGRYYHHFTVGKTKAQRLKCVTHDFIASKCLHAWDLNPHLIDSKYVLSTTVSSVLAEDT